ncbi:MAG: FHA domain-containing protein [Tannerella sp.]|jgi:predicted Zn finger-like uncharacterized protein|nr:FHA domain-containing protein [Tannerella sp.]
MIPVKCPHCKVGLKVDEQKIPKGITSFKCPKCKHEIPVSILELNKETQSDAETNTIVLRPLKKKEGILTVLPSEGAPEQRFELREGVFIVGRKAASSNADICIDTNDKLMSRSHLRIEVKTDSQGGLIHVISDNHSKNRTMYNGKYMEDGEVVVLKNNDEIMIGRTILRFND